MSDDLVRRWREGDFEAFLELARPQLGSLRALAAYFAPPSGSLWDADDLAQEALVEAFRSARAFDESRGDFRSWLGGVVRNRVRRAWQEAGRDRRRRERSEEILRRLFAARAQEPDAEAPLEVLRSCVERLPERSRGLVRAHYGEGRPAQEIAGRLGTTASSVFVTLHRIRKALRACVEGKLSPGLDGSAT
jgi:RNA polymerase sigma-70 factor (ECF subfamily)